MNGPRPVPASLFLMPPASRMRKGSGVDLLVAVEGFSAPARPRSDLERDSHRERAAPGRRQRLPSIGRSRFHTSNAWSYVNRFSQRSTTPSRLRQLPGRSRLPAAHQPLFFGAGLLPIEAPRRRPPKSANWHREEKGSSTPASTTHLSPDTAKQQQTD